MKNLGQGFSVYAIVCMLAVKLPHMGTFCKLFSALSLTSTHTLQQVCTGSQGHGCHSCCNNLTIFFLPFLHVFKFYKSSIIIWKRQGKKIIAVLTYKQYPSSSFSFPFLSRQLGQKWPVPFLLQQHNEKDKKSHF